MANFSERLKELREKRGLTQERLAEDVGVARSTIGGYEAPSKLREPEFDLVRRLAGYFGVSTDYLLGRTDDPRPGAPFVLPKEVDELSPDMRAFLEKEAADGWPHIRLVYDAVSKGLRTSDLEQVLALLIQVKQREESGEDRNA